MIPSIDEILTGYTAGTYSAAQAKALIQQHIELSVDGAVLRDEFAAAALQGQLSACVKRPDMLTLARECYEHADAMVSARAERVRS